MVIDYFTIKNKWKMTPTKVLHVGAHHGQELGIYFNDPGITDLVFFEPMKSSYDVLIKNLEQAHKPSHLNTLIAHPVGLGPEEKEVDFYVASNGQSSSVLKPQLHATQYRDILFNSIERVKIKTLDSFNYFDYDFLTMDVQGYELEVLKGATKTLNNIKWLYTEVNNAPLYENCAMVEDLDNFLRPYGFKREDTVWCRTFGNWGDAIYVKG